ncbi:MAG: hypothetical protein L0G70_11800, partial [Rubrobacter sp.]|nr:hypothetical protein [Rubrobacter sp.]
MQKEKKRGLLLTLAFLSVVPTTAHLIYSWMGFSPTDQGFTLSYSRRLLEGQVPHLDFIIIRPFLSPLIHTPFVLFGGEYTFWISRFFVWFQYAVIAWTWVSAVNHVFGRPFGAAMKALLGVAVFAASAHHFVITAWHSIDGLFLASIGVWLLATRRSQGTRFGGYVLVGAAYLAKQSFILVPPLFLLALGDWRKPRYWIATAVPGLLYVAYLLVSGAFTDAFAQLTSQTGIVSTGVFSYLTYVVALGVAAGVGSMLLISAGEKMPLVSAGAARALGSLTLVGIPAGFITAGMIVDALSLVSFGIFGILLGVAAVMLIETALRKRRSEPVDTGPVRLALLALILAWSVSLSFGYNAPGLAMGPMLLVLAAIALPGLSAPSPKLAPAAL